MEILNLLIYNYDVKFMRFSFYLFFTLLVVVLATEQKEKLNDVEQQLKKAEAAQRRRMQVEKAARESEVHLFILLLYICLCLQYGLVRL